MQDVTYVSQERYDELVALIGRRRVLVDRLHNKMKRASLVEKLAVQKEISEIGKELAK